jgi:hypothetical protein
MELSYNAMSWHQQQAWKRGAAAIISGKPDVQHGYRYCDCCGVTDIGPLDDDPFNCGGCENGECNPAETQHCFTGYCDGSACSYNGECHLRWDWEPEFTFEPEARPGLKVEIAASGGGTVGQAYEAQEWKYRVSKDDEPFYAGEMWGGYRPTKHDQMARELLDFLEADHVIPELV